MERLNKILLIDDDFILNFLNQVIIEELDITNEVVIKTDGHQALEYIKHCYIDKTANCPDLILLDVNMPVMGGFEVLEKIKDIGLNNIIENTIAILTTSENQKDRQYLQKLGIVNIIHKPLTKEKLLTLIQKIKR